MASGSLFSGERVRERERSKEGVGRKRLRESDVGRELMVR